jgi:hypothetical protein
MFGSSKVFCVLSALLVCSGVRGEILRRFVARFGHSHIDFSSNTAAEITKCAYEDSDCMINVANEIVSRGSIEDNGLGVGVIDPRMFEKASIDHKGSSVQMNIELRDFLLRGVSGIRFSKIEGFKKDFEKAKIELNFNFPTMFIEGEDVV